MKAIIIYFYVAILPLIIHGNLQLLQQQLEEMANKNRSIDEIFKPAVSGYRGRGSFALTFKGTLLKPIEREVAMKFTPLTFFGAVAENEFETYTYLGAINNTNDVESYGIPAVYYYGKWNDYIMMAITLLDSEYGKRLAGLKLNDVDIMIILREFVRISKYIHSRGVHHGDIKLENMMFRKQSAFIIDFNLASRLYRTNSFRKFGNPPENVYEDRRRVTLEHWSNFLDEVRHYTGFSQEWFNKLALCISRNEDPNQCSDLKDYIPSNNQFAKKEFREVFAKCFYYKYKLDDCYKNALRFQLYDDLHQFISAKIDELKLPKPVFVSWLSDKERKMAKKELESKQLPDISSIEDRFANVQAEYPEVNFNYFSEMNEENKILKTSESKDTQYDPEDEPSSSTSTTGKNKKGVLSKAFGRMGLSKKR